MRNSNRGRSYTTSFSRALPITVFMLFILALASLIVGSVWIDPLDILADIFTGEGLSPVEETIVYARRIPIVLGSIAAGALLALSGFLYQSLFRNPMADPYVLGTASASFLTIVLGTYISIYIGELFRFGATLLPIFSAAGAAIYTGGLVAISSRMGSLQLLLIGISLGFVFTGISIIFLSMLPPDVAGLLSLAMFGSFERLSWEYSTYLAISLFILATPSIYYSVRSLDPMILGEEYARSLGIDIRALRIVVSLIAGIATSITVAFIGVIGFLGFVAPHVARLMIGSSRSIYVLPLSMVLGSLILLVCLVLVRILFPGGDLPITAITSIFGGPLLVYLVSRMRGEYSW